MFSPLQESLFLISVKLVHRRGHHQGHRSKVRFRFFFLWEEKTGQVQYGAVTVFGVLFVCFWWAF